MRDENMSMSDGLVMRSLLAYPGGLELHIGARPCTDHAAMQACDPMDVTLLRPGHI